jgi:Protein of unknown function (DUF3224)
MVTTTLRATGQFLVDFEPLAADDEVIGRMRVTKAFTGGLSGTSVAQMLSVGTAVEGSTGHVAVERFTGELDGRHGGFMLVHAGMMRRGETSLAVTVVPDSGTGELLGLRGTFGIDNLGSRHEYTFDYAFDTP